MYDNRDINNLIDEIWKKIKGFPKYQISNFGRVKSFKQKRNGRILKQQINIVNGYLQIRLSRNNRVETKFVHRLLLKLFTNSNYTDLEINHINGIKSDNRLENLEWINHFKNMKHFWKSDLSNKTRLKMSETQHKFKGNKSPNHKLNQNDIIRIRDYLKEELLTQKEIAKRFNISQQMISKINNNKNWST